MNNGKPVSIVMIEDDEGHARLIEKNIRRAGVNNEIIPFSNGTAALKYLLGEDGSGSDSEHRHLAVLGAGDIEHRRRIGQGADAGQDVEPGFPRHVVIQRDRVEPLRR